MNRTDRLLAIILELQGKKAQRAEDLARTFETSKRTIYRDMQALLEAGVPVVSQPGQGYALMEGYFLPPLSFTHDEALMLLAGAGLMADSFDAEYRMAARNAAHKIETVIPERSRGQVSELQEGIRFIAPGSIDPAERATLPTLRRAILRRQTLRFAYHTRIGQSGAPETNMREADPYGLINVDGAWLLYGYCHLRRDTRNFRLSRMESIQVLPRGFERPPNFLDSEAARMRASQTRTAIVVFDHQAARWIAEDQFFHISERQPTADGLCVTLRMRHEQEIIPWLLSWVGHIVRAEPESLRVRLVAALRAGLRALDTP